MADDLRETIAKRLYAAHEGEGGNSWGELCRDYPALRAVWLRVADEAIAMAHEVAAMGLAAQRGDA